MSAEAELERLYDAHAPALFAFGLQLTRNEPDTRDLLQDAFVNLARRPDLLEGVRDERAFLLRWIRNAAIDLMRRRQTRRATLERLEREPVELFAPSHDPDEAAWRRAVADGLEELPPAQREVLHLKLWEGLTFEAIARILDIPPDTAASRYRYGLDKLRDRLRPLSHLRS